jgi:hypothetical protein
MATDIEVRLGLEWESLAGAHLPMVDSIVENGAPEKVSRRAALVELEDVRLSCAELRTHIEGSGSDGILATSRWTVREVIAHLASWAMRTRHELESLVDGSPLLETIHFEREGGPRAWNQRQIDIRHGRSTAALFGELDTEISQIADVVISVREQLLRQVAEVPRTSGDPSVPWRIPVVAMVIGSCWHMRYHLARLERL